MRSPLPQLTTILLLIHLGFGCCMHHTHACESDCCATPAASVETCPCDTHRHDDPPVRHDDGQHQCDGNPCSFVSSDPVPEEVGEFALAICSLEVVTAGATSGLSLAHLDHSLDRRLPFAGTSLRTHLVLRVLLI